MSHARGVAARRRCFESSRLQTRRDGGVASRPGGPVGWSRIAWLPSAVLLAAAVAVGLLAEAVAFGWGDLQAWAPDVAAGWLFVGGGVAANRAVRGSRAGALMVAAGLAWFVGNFESSEVPALDWLGQHGKFVYVGVLVQLPLALLGDVIGRRATALVVGASYLAVLWPLESATWIAARMLVLGAVVLV